MAKGGDWHTFDTTYRKELAVLQKSFYTLRPDLEIVAYTSVLAPLKKRFHPYRGNNGSDAEIAGHTNDIPSGKCFRFHGPDKYCNKSAEECEFDHSCDRCGGGNIHPRYKCDKPTGSTVGSGLVQ